MTATERKLLIGGIAAAILYGLSRSEKGQTVAADTLESIINAGGAVAGALLPRGIRNNNPGNIRFLPPARAWRGQKPEPDAGGFGIYDTAANGVRALGRQLLAYEARGLTTVRKIIDTFAPPNENNTGAYRAAVAGELDVGEDSTLNVRDRLYELARAIIHHENGMQPYTERELREWVYT